MIELVDIGVNLTHARFARDRAAVLGRAQSAGVTRLVLTGVNVSESQAAAAFAKTHPTALRSTAGVHPHHAAEVDSQALENLRALAADPIVAAMGETGLDYNRDFSPRLMQRKAFSAQLALAAELNLPVFLHQRDAEADFIAILTEHRHALPAAVLHCFTGDAALLERCLALDLFIGVTGWVCDERRGQTLRDCLPDVPMQRLMLETDAPFLLPRDLPEKPRNGRNEPAFLPHIALEVARLMQLDADQLARQTASNSLRFFGF